MKKIDTFSIEDRLPLDRLKHGRLRVPVEKNLRRMQDEQTEAINLEKIGQTGKEWIENLLEVEKDVNADFELSVIKRGARRFSDWIENETKK